MSSSSSPQLPADAPPPGSTAAARPTNSSAARVRFETVVLDLDRLRGQVSTQESEMKELKAALAATERGRAEALVVLRLVVKETKRSQAEVEILQKRVVFLETALGVVESNELGDEEGGEGGTGENDIALQDAETQAITEAELRKLQLSIAAVNTRVVKAAVSKVFQHVMGVKTLVASKLPPHPNFPSERGVHPVDPGTGEKLVRFRWDKPGSHAMNVDALQTVTTAVRTHGPQLFPNLAVVLPMVLEAHLEERVAKKYKLLHVGWMNELKQADEDSGEEPQQEDELDDLFDDQEDAETQPAGRGTSSRQTGGGRKKPKASARLMALAVHNSRVKSRLTVRIRKRSKHIVWRDPKYDAAFTLNATSEDEDDPSAPEGTKRYRSRGGDWQSVELRTCKDETDAQEDGNPPPAGRMIYRVRGEDVKDAVPLKSKKVENSIRMWMVAPEFLEKHPEWITNGFVIPNGTLWGDTEDPVAVPGRSITKKRKDELAELEDRLPKKQKRRAIDRSEAEKHGTELQTLLGGQDMEEMVNRLG